MFGIVRPCRHRLRGRLSGEWTAPSGRPGNAEPLAEAGRCCRGSRCSSSVGTLLLFAVTDLA